MDTAISLIPKIPGTNLPQGYRESKQEVNIKLPNALHNDADPQYLIENEKVVHRRMQAMLLDGFNYREIANFFGYTEKHVSNILRQPYARANMIQEVKKGVQDELKNFLEGEVMPSLTVLKDIRDNEKAPLVLRAECAEKLINRFLGKPKEIVENKTDKPAETLSNEELEQRVRATLEGMGEA